MILREDFEIDSVDKTITYYEDDIFDVATWLIDEGYLEGWEHADIEDALEGLDNEKIDASVPFTFTQLYYDYEDDVDETNYDPYAGCDIYEKMNESAWKVYESDYRDALRILDDCIYDLEDKIAPTILKPNLLGELEDAIRYIGKKVKEDENLSDEVKQKIIKDWNLDESVCNR